MGSQRYGYYVQEASAAWSGIWVYDRRDEVREQLGIGDKVEVTAEINEYFALTELWHVSDWRFVDDEGDDYEEEGEVEEGGDGGDDDEEEDWSDWRAEGRGALAPLVVKTGDVGSGCNALGEQYEGLLVRLKGVTIQTEPDEHGQLVVDDGSGPTRLDDEIFDTDGYLLSVLGGELKGQHLDSITGVVRFAYGVYALHPRDRYDVDVDGQAALRRDDREMEETIEARLRRAPQPHRSPRQQTLTSVPLRMHRRCCSASRGAATRGFAPCCTR